MKVISDVTAEIKGILAYEFDPPPPEWDLCGPVVNDEDFGDDIGPTIACNVLKQASAVIFHMLLLVNSSRNIIWQKYLGLIFIAEFWLAHGKCRTVSATLNETVTQSPFLQNLLALQERDTDGKERWHRSLYRIEHELCNDSFQAINLLKRLIWDKLSASVDTVLCCQLATWAMRVNWWKQIAVVEETLKFCVRGPGYITSQVSCCLTHSAGLV